MKYVERVSVRRSAVKVTRGWVASGVALLAALGASCSAGEHGVGTTEGTAGSGTAGSGTTSSGTTSSGTTSSGTSGTAKGVTGISGGTLDTLNFAIVGDTRPPNPDDTAGYPTPIITKIWQDVEAVSPRPAFAVTTGDYMFCNTYNTQQGPQMALYLGARAAFTGVTFAAMGNHECTGADASNCGTGNTNGITPNYTTFLTKMLQPLGVSLPYYTVNLSSATSGAWTAKLVFTAANAWDATQAAWLDAELAKPTTYTFVIRHEGVSSDSSTKPIPGIKPSEAILAKHPWTLKIVGHTHTYEYRQSDREIVVGNGGAPPTGSVNYGYVVARQRADGAIVFQDYDYMTNASQQTVVVKADGTPTN